MPLFCDLVLECFWSYLQELSCDRLGKWKPICHPDLINLSCEDAEAHKDIIPFPLIFLVHSDWGSRRHLARYPSGAILQDTQAAPRSSSHGQELRPLANNQDWFSIPVSELLWKQTFQPKSSIAIQPMSWEQPCEWSGTRATQQAWFWVLGPQTLWDKKCLLLLEVTKFWGNLLHSTRQLMQKEMRQQW